MRHILNIFVGAVVSLLVGCILVGPDTLGFLLMLSVLCTAGFGLIPLFALFWLVGILVLSFIPKAQPAPSSNGPPKWGPGRQGVQALAYYLEKAKLRGKSDEEIDFCMARAGWMPDEIEEARHMVSTLIRQ